MRVGSGNFWQFVRKWGNSNAAGAATDAASARTALGLGTLATLSSVATGNIDDDAVTYAKIQNISAASRILGRGSAAGAGNTEELAISTGLTLTGTVLTSTGKVAQIVSTSSTANTTLNPQIPSDDSIPQITEGTEIMTLAITPTNASSILDIEAWVPIGDGASCRPIVALFVDATANAIAVSSGPATTGSVPVFVLKHRVSAGSTASRTYRLRAGPDTTNDAFLNGDSSGRLFGGISQAWFTVTEYLP